MSDFGTSVWSNFGTCHFSTFNFSTLKFSEAKSRGKKTLEQKKRYQGGVPHHHVLFSWCWFGRLGPKARERETGARFRHVGEIKGQQKQASRREDRGLGGPLFFFCPNRGKSVKMWRVGRTRARGSKIATSVSWRIKSFLGRYRHLTATRHTHATNNGDLRPTIKTKIFNLTSFTHKKTLK